MTEGIVHFVKRIRPIVAPNGIHCSAVQSTAIPAKMILAVNVALEANDMHRLAGSWMSHRVHHVMGSQCVTDSDIQSSAHQVEDRDLVVP